MDGNRASPGRTSLRQRILTWLLVYAVLLTMAVVAHGFIVNEQAEQLVWQALLDSEMDHVLERKREDPTFRWIDSPAMSLYDTRESTAIPRELHSLEEGVHDDVPVAGGERVVLVRKVDGGRVMLTLDITELEDRELDMTLMIAGSALALILLIAIGIAWSVNRLMRPLGTMARDIADLRPDQPGQRIRTSDSASSELIVIAEALNDYLARNDLFVERERVFIDSASHELRTPIAVIGAASSLALDDVALSTKSRHQLERIQRTSRAIHQLIALLLVLAKDPRKLARASDRIALHELIPEIVDDHRYLAEGKELTIETAALPSCEIDAPTPIVRTAIGNLLRNAIENSDRGRIVVGLAQDATVTIEDPGHGMSPEEIGEIYARLARGGGGRGGGGIGMDLISRVCEHLGWTLDIRSDHSGTRTTLHLLPIT